jgi:hypothetical protein
MLFIAAIFTDFKGKMIFYARSYIAGKIVYNAFLRYMMKLSVVLQYVMNLRLFMLLKGQMIGIFRSFVAMKSGVGGLLIQGCQR